MKSLKYIAPVLLSAAMVAGCSDEREALGGEGRVFLSATLNSDVTVVSRTATEQELGESAIIWVSNSQGPVRKYKGINSVPAEGVWLTSGTYTAEAWAGDSVPASFESKYYKGVETFDVASGSTARVDIVCHVANVVSSVNYADEVDDVLKDYTMTVSHDRGELVFEGRDDRKGYFMMPSTDKNLTWTLAGTDNTGKPFSRTGVINNVQPQHEYVLNVRMTQGTDEIGGAYLTVEVDDRTNDIVDNITISTVPDIKGYNFDITTGLNSEAGKFTRRSVWALASNKLKRVELQCPYFATVLGNASDVDFDFCNMTDEFRTALAAKGINAAYSEDAVSGSSRMKINFEPEFLNSLPDGKYEIVIIAEDAQGKVSRQPLSINVSDAPLHTSEFDASPANLRATQATISGVVVKSEDAANPVLEYRVKGTPTWTAAQTTRTENTLTATLTGLTPATTYEYRAVCDAYKETEVYTFTTEAAPQIKNGGFEDWNTSGKAYLLCTNEGDMFWDSGNHGSATLNINITTPSSDVKHGGSYAARLESAYPSMFGIGKFAAGNCFVGKYLDTAGTDGILGWGREFTGRPKALRGWVKYTPATVQKKGSGSYMAQGATDQGIIYVALVSNTTCDDKNAEYKNAWPVVVRTADKQFFDSNGTNVIAYGEKVLTSATEGEGLIEFEIPIDYRTWDVLPKRLVLVCSASRYGDYFQGAIGSVMYVDDFEFVY